MNQEEYIRVLQDVIRIQSENNHEKLVAQYYQTLLADYGINSQLIEFSEGRCNLVAEISNGEGKTLAISGHMDVVSAGDESQWTHPPFSGYIEDGLIWGRGASDMKSGLSALILAMIEMNQSQNYKGTIRLLATVGEEIGELGSKQLTDLGYINDVDGMIIGEPCNIGVVYGHKGSLNYKVISRGLAAHSSAPELGHNAIDNLFLAMTEISDRISAKAKGLTNKVLGETFHNITLIKGGTQINSIPDFAEYEANVRTVPEFDNDAIVREVSAIIGELNTKPGFDLSLKITADQPPVETNPDSSLIRTIIDVVNDIDTLKPESLIQSMGQIVGLDLDKLDSSLKGKKDLGVMTVSGTTDAAQFIRANKELELAVYGPGMPMLNHKANERIPISQYLDFIKAYVRIMEGYLS